MPGFLDRFNGLFADPQIPQGGVMGEPQFNPQGDAKLAMASALLAGSSGGPQYKGFGEIMGNALMAGQAARQQAQQLQMRQAALQSEQRLNDAQAQRLGAESGPNIGALSPDHYTPESIAKFRQSGNYADLVPVAENGSDTSDMKNYQFFQTLTPEQQKQFQALQRQPTAPQLTPYQGGLALIDRFTGSVTPLTTAQEEAKGAGVVASGRAAGEVAGSVQGGIQKKGVDAQSSNVTLDLAEPLIQAATGSLVGAGRDKLASAFGAAPTGAQAIAQLKILQANLMTSMPRMEGPQSDKDVQLYRDAAGNIGDPTVPAPIKKAAVATIRQLNDKYVERANKSKVVDFGSLK